MELKMMKLKDLIPYSKNAKKHSKEQIKNVAESIKEFGWQQPIVVDENNVIIIGHCRYQAARFLKLETAPVHVATGLDENQVNKLRLLDNKTNESDWDLDLLIEQIPELDFSNYDIDWGLPEKEFDITEDDFDLDQVMDSIEEPTAKLGDVYRLGKHYLMCGDSTNLENVKELMRETKVDLFLTDPPYNVDYEGTAGKIQNDNMADSEFNDFLIQAFSCANEVMKAGAPFYIWHADSEGYNFRTACKRAGWTVRQCIIWNKNSLVLGRQDYQWKHEPCLYGWKDGAGHKWYSGRSETTVLDFDKPKHNDLHPTMKPVALISYEIKNSTKEEDCVLDLFGGSGTTLIACEELNRVCYMMELDPKFVDVIIKRWENMTGRKAEKIN